MPILLKSQRRNQELKQQFNGNLSVTGAMQEKCRYEFGEFRLETGLGALFRQDTEVHLSKRHFEVLLYLIENRDRLVTRSELLHRFWDAHNVYDDALSKCVGSVRKALSDNEKSPRFVETRRGSGYRFVGEVTAFYSLEGSGDDLTSGNQDFPPGPPFWRSRIILRLIVAAILFVSVSFVVGLYLPWDGKSPKPGLPGISSIAVLPLKNLTGDAGNDYLSDGLTEGLITEFSRNSKLRVISRSASFTFKGKEIDLNQIREKLKVDVVLEGSLRKIGDEMRFEVSLVDVKDGNILWTNDAATSLFKNIFTVQNRIACEVLTKIEAGGCTRIETAKNVDAEAYRLYLQGIHIRNDLTLEAMTTAIELFEKALAIEPNFAKAHEGLATTYVVMESNSQVPPGSVIKKAEFHAKEALKLDENSVDALLVLSETETAEDYNLPLRENLLRQAVEKDPNFGRSRMWLANILTVRGKFAEAESELLKLQEADPLSTGVLFTLCELYLYWRKPDEALNTAKLLSELSTPDAIPDRLFAKAYLQKGDLEEVRMILEKRPDNYESMQIIWLVKTGKIDEARKELKKLELTQTGKTSPFVIAYLYAEVGDTDSAFIWLERSYATRQSDLISLKVEPYLDSLREDPRYSDFLRRLNLTDQDTP